MIVKTKNENQYYLSDNKKEMLILPELLSDLLIVMVVFLPIRLL